MQLMVVIHARSTSGLAQFLRNARKDQSSPFEDLSMVGFGTLDVDLPKGMNASVSFGPEAGVS